tara:strand:+ start:14992 stop:15681 length:690 start_codon:yes stop_codon:yes gene_type:complete
MDKINNSWRRLIISDTHLGSAYAKEAELFHMLCEEEFDELILAGDILEFLRKPKFTSMTKKIINIVNSKPKKVIYIVGNHDDALESFIGQSIFSIKFVREYEFIHYNRKFRIQHGDQYDTGVVKWRYTIEFISFIQNMIERVFKVDLTTWWAKRQTKKRKLKRIWDLVKWNNAADVFIMGHTHNPEVLIWVDKNESIKTYVNTGDWVDNCTYVTVKNGAVRLRKYDHSF